MITKRVRFAVLLVLLAVLLGVFLVGCASTQDVLNVNLRDHSNLAVHVHPILAIEIQGGKYTIPANMGISDTGMRVIHTHDDTGKLHVESPYPHQFFLRDVFAVWGWTWSEKEFMGHPITPEHTVLVYVNGALYEGPKPGDLPLDDAEEIKIVYN